MAPLNKQHTNEMGILKYLGSRKQNFTRAGKTPINISVAPGEIINVDDFGIEQSLISTGMFERQKPKKEKSGSTTRSNI